jgi:hypothetical protein
MNMTYESLKERGALMVVPTGMVSSMGGLVDGVGRVRRSAPPHAGRASCRSGGLIPSVMFGHVSQYSLRRSRLQLEDRPLDGAALFPLFDEAGRTRAVMLLDGQTRRIVLADWTPDLFERRWLQRHRLRLRFADLRDADASDAERLGDLWHFDPVVGAP